MGYYITYDSITQFAPGTVHSDTAHNTPHNNLVGNDGQLDAALYAANNTIASLQSQITALASQIANIPQGRIVSTALSGFDSGGTYPNIGGVAKSYTYTYTGAYVPLFITARFSMYGGSNAVIRIQYRWLNISGSALSSYIDVVALNPMGGGDGGAALNDTWQATIPFIVGARSIQMQDLYYSTRTQFSIQTITEHQIPRWGDWGY